MAISSAGIGSGLDVNSIVSQMVALEKRPIAQLQSSAASIQTKLSTYSQVKSLMSTLSDAASKLTRDSAWNGMSVNSTNSAGVSASVTGIASATSFGVSVQQLARAQSVASTALAAADAPVGAGTLTIQLGTWMHTAPPPNFVPGAAAAVDVTVGATDSLSTIAAKINDAKAGVTATVLRDASGERLLVRSAATGEASGFRIQVAEDSGAPGLSQLSFDPKDAPGQGMAANTVQYGLNTQAKLNGIEVSSTDNTFANTIPGLKLTVSQVTTDEVNMTVGADTVAMKKNMQDFVDAYNAVNDLLSASTKYDSETKTAGVLQGDNTAVGLQNALRMLTMGSGGWSGCVSAPGRCRHHHGARRQAGGQWQQAGRGAEKPCGPEGAVCHDGVRRIGRRAGGSVQELHLGLALAGRPDEQQGGCPPAPRPSAIPLSRKR